MRVYLDASIVLYAIEQAPGFGRRAETHLRSLSAAGAQFLVSDLTRIECRATPLAAGNLAVLGDYDAFFQTVVSQIVELTTPVCDRATSICGRYRFKVPDSLHLAAAIESRCDVFLTNDLPLRRCTDIPVQILP